MNTLSKFDLDFMLSVERSLNLVPSQLDSLSEDLWRSKLLSLSNQLSDISLLNYCYNESN